jgi:hypothetical protein
MTTCRLHLGFGEFRRCVPLFLLMLWNFSPVRSGAAVVVVHLAGLWAYGVLFSVFFCSFYTCGLVCFPGVELVSVICFNSHRPTQHVGAAVTLTTSGLNLSAMSTHFGYSQ